MRFLSQHFDTEMPQTKVAHARDKLGRRLRLGVVDRVAAAHVGN